MGKQHSRSHQYFHQENRAILSSTLRSSQWCLQFFANAAKSLVNCATLHMKFYVSMSHFSISWLINNLTFFLTLFSISSLCNSIESPSSRELIFGSSLQQYWFALVAWAWINSSCQMVDALTMIPLLFAAILSYAAAGTLVFTPSGYCHLGGVFAMFYLLCNYGVEHNIMVRRNIWYVCSLHISLHHIKILSGCIKLMYVCWTLVDYFSWSEIFGSMAILLSIFCNDAT